MASLFTNASAQTALQTLTKASKNLAATQSRVATGYRINTAEDNAAYWSIAATLRSDVGALNAVQDALGLGAATVDTVYTGINDTKDLLDQIKSKLVTASQSGVPRKQVQAEISQLQNRLKDVSTSTVINGETWLTQKSDDPGYNSTKTIVGSFTRAGGAITLENITIDINQTKLYEGSKTLQDAVTSTLDSSAASTARKAYEDAFAVSKAVAAVTTANWGTAVTAVDTALKTAITNLPANNAIVAGTTTPANLTTHKGTVAGLAVGSTVASLEAAIVTAFTATPSAAGAAAIRDAISTADKSALLQEIGTALQAYQTGTSTGAALAGATATADEAAYYNDLNVAFRSAVATAVTSFLNQESVTTAVATKIGNDARTAYEAAAKADAHNNSLGIFDKVRTVVSAADGSGAKAVRVSDMDISKLTDTEFDRSILASYLTAVDDALQELTLSASVIGAAKARVEGNRTFVKNLVDANNRGIGQLVDADLNEESSKLKALQVQEQLAIQALGIANNSTQNILSLFQ